MHVSIRAMYGYNSLLKKQEEQEALLPCLKPFILHTSDWSSSISCTISEQIEGWARAKAEGPSQQSDLPKMGWNTFWRSIFIFMRYQLNISCNITGGWKQQKKYLIRFGIGDVIFDWCHQSSCRCYVVKIRSWLATFKDGILYSKPSLDKWRHQFLLYIL